MPREAWAHVPQAPLLRPLQIHGPEGKPTGHGRAPRVFCCQARHALAASSARSAGQSRDRAASAMRSRHGAYSLRRTQVTVNQASLMNVPDHEQADIQYRTYSPDHTPGACHNSRIRLSSRDGVRLGYLQLTCACRGAVATAGPWRLNHSRGRQILP